MKKCVLFTVFVSIVSPTVADDEKQSSDDLIANRPSATWVDSVSNRAFNALSSSRVLSIELGANAAGIARTAAQSGLEASKELLSRGQNMSSVAGGRMYDLAQEKLHELPSRKWMEDVALSGSIIIPLTVGGGASCMVAGSFVGPVVGIAAGTACSYAGDQFGSYAVREAFLYSGRELDENALQSARVVSFLIAPTAAARSAGKWFPKFAIRSSLPSYLTSKATEHVYIPYFVRSPIFVARDVPTSSD